MTYSPIKDGIDKENRSVRYLEVKPPEQLLEFVHCYWELRTETPLTEDFMYHIVPDACVNILFDQKDTSIAAITAINTKSITLNLGTDFHYIGVQLLPGVWNGDPREIKSELVNSKYEGDLNLIAINDTLAHLTFAQQQSILSATIEDMIEKKVIVSEPVTAKILAHLDAVHTVQDMADISCLSPRQLQRKLKQVTGFTPHNFLKVIRLQQSFREHYLDYYADQSHFIHSFRQIIGYTPAKYSQKYNV